jgi:U4/U6.U5 tri-snRNP-associated protein 2
LAEKNGEF